MWRRRLSALMQYASGVGAEVKIRPMDGVSDISESYIITPVLEDAKRNAIIPRKRAPCLCD